MHVITIKYIRMLCCSFTSAAGRNDSIETRQLSVSGFMQFHFATAGPELINISLKWNSPKEKPFLKNLSLKIKNGNILCVFGKSGVGKSSLINVILYQTNKENFI